MTSGSARPVDGSMKQTPQRETAISCCAVPPLRIRSGRLGAPRCSLRLLVIFLLFVFRLSYIQMFRMKTKRILVHSSAGPYSVICGAGVLRHAAREIAQLGQFSSVHLVSSPKVWRAVGKRVQRGFGVRNPRAIHLMNDAESAKNLRAVEALSRALIQSRADRKSLLVAVGGGVVGDVAGFAASSYLRGLKLVHVPTTLVSQVDSSIGGKTGVNLPEGKNLVGAFYPPALVL